MALQGLRSAFNRGGSEPDPRTAAVLTPAASSITGGAVIGCPSCGRAMRKGSRRCAGCGQRLLLDVPARKASMLLGSGLLAGFVVGGLLVGLTLPRQAATAGSGPGASAGSAAGTTVSANAAAALRGTVTLNGRLATDAEPLAQALAAKSFPVDDVVAVMRRMSTNTRAAAAMVKSLATWPDAASQQAALAAFYTELSGELNDALAASVSSTSAYRSATQGVLATLGRIVTLDANARTLASGAGIDLPDVVIPAALR